MAFDRRARLRPKWAAKDYVYGTEGLLQILRTTDGLVWPYTPTINVAQSIDYSSYDPVHSNQEFMTFSRTKAPQITCSGMFTAQNATEARYMLACLHFLRSVTKMDFGVNAEKPGTPPPVLLFSAYGQYMFNDLPVVITNFTFDLPQNKDYMKVPVSIDELNGLNAINIIEPDNSEPDTWVPSEMTMAVTMVVQNSPSRMTETFNLKEFKTGELLSNSKTKGWI